VLSEALRVARALADAGVETEATSGDVRSPGPTSGAWARFLLGQNGGVSGVAAITPDEAEGLWTIMEGNQNSFPVVRLKVPLIALPVDHPLWDRLREAGRKANSDALVARVLLDTVPGLPVTATDVAQWDRLRLKKAPQVLARAEVAAPDVSELCRRFVLATSAADKFVVALAEAILDALRAGRTELARFAKDLLVGNEPLKGKNETRVQLAFDLDNGRSIYLRANRRAMSATASATGEGEMSPCAFSGHCEDVMAEPFPKVRFPVLGRDYPLLSMFSDARCNVRYGLTDQKIVPVSGALVRQGHSALSHLLSNEYRDTLWRPIASGQFTTERGRKVERADLLVAFVVEGQARIGVTSLFSVPRGANYGVEARAVCDALKGIAHKNSSARLDLFVVRAVSKGQAQTTYAERPTVKEVLDGATAWEVGQANRPESIVRSSRLVPPEGMVRLLAEQWTLDASRNSKVEGLLLGDVVDLLTRQPGRSRIVANRALSLLADRTWPLLRKVAGDLRQNQPVAPIERLRTHQAQNVAALCLAHLGCTKEIYMNEPAYLVGRLLSVADKLHLQYCRVVRNGDVPPSLIGNGLLGSALDSPVSALAVLAERLRIYIGWAKTSEVQGEATRIPVLTAKKALREFAEVEAMLGGKLREGRCSDLEKAQMLLGYLARGNAEESDTNQEETEDTQDEQ